MEKHIQSKDGKRFLDFGFRSQTAVGSGPEKPSDTVPIQEGFRILCTIGIEKWWRLIVGGLTVRKLLRAPFRKKKRR